MIVKKGKFVIEGLENVQINIGAIGDEEAQLEAEGPTPRPEVITLRNWDYRLLDRYNPTYTPMSDMCDYCTYGKCDLTGNKEGACGIDLEDQSAREALRICITGAACHTAHGRHLFNYFIKKYGKDHPIDLGQSNLKAPLIETIMGIQPQTIGDFLPVLEYIEEQLTQLTAVTHTGQEGSARDFESKTLHAGMLDHLGMEVADILQISCLGFPKSDEKAPLAEIGMGILDPKKPVVICIGHNIAAPAYILDYMDSKGLFDKIEIAGLCKELKYIRSGIPDVLVTDEQCVRADILKEAQKLHIPVIATNEKITYDLPDRSNDSVDAIIDDLVSGKQAGAPLLDFEKIGELVAKCIKCQQCTRDCPQGLPISDAMAAAVNGDLTQFEVLHDKDVLARAIAIGQRSIQIAAVGNAYTSLGDKGPDVHYINMHALASYLCDPNWKGLDGKGNYDLVVFFGITYYYVSQAISALKNFSNIKVISIDRYYHPNADMSFGNLKDDVFIAALDEVIKELPVR